MKRKRENRGKEDSHEAIENVKQKECVSQRRVKGSEVKKVKSIRVRVRKEECGVT